MAITEERFAGVSVTGEYVVECTICGGVVTAFPHSSDAVEAAKEHAKEHRKGDLTRARARVFSGRTAWGDAQDWANR